MDGEQGAHMPSMTKGKRADREHHPRLSLFPVPTFPGKAQDSEGRGELSSFQFSLISNPLPPLPFLTHLLFLYVHWVHHSERATELEAACPSVLMPGSPVFGSTPGPLI